jgi:hypothetical protein
MRDAVCQWMKVGGDDDWRIFNVGRWLIVVWSIEKKEKKCQRLWREWQEHEWDHIVETSAERERTTCTGENGILGI